MFTTQSSRFRVAAAMFVVGVLAVLALPSTAAAHTDFDYSLPTDGASVGEPVSEITVAFSDAVTLVGPGFEVLDPQGNVVQPFAVTDDDQVFRLQLDPALVGGDVGVRWEVAASDGHVLSGSFSFTVTADATIATTTPPTTASETATAEPAVPPSTASATEAQPSTVDTVVATSTDSGTIASGSTVDAIAADGEAESAADAPNVDDGASGSGDDDGGSAGLIIALAVAVAVGAGAFVLVRSRRT